MQQLQSAYHQFQSYLTVAGIVLAVLLAWWALGKARGALGTLLRMPIGKKLWLATLVLTALWFAGMLGLEPMHSYLVRHSAPATPLQAIGLAYAIKKSALYWMDTHTWLPFALGAVTFVALIWRRV